MGLPAVMNPNQGKSPKKELTVGRHLWVAAVEAALREPKGSMYLYSSYLGLKGVPIHGTLTALSTLL